MSSAGHLTVLPGASSALTGGAAATIISEIPEMISKLSPKEKKVWTHVTDALLEYGLIHRTDAMLLTIICRTYCEWVDATEQLEKYKKDHDGNYITESANGYRTPHPLYYVARDHKKALLTWLPEAALTIPSFQKIKGAETVPSQGSLFDDPVEAFKARKVAASMRLVEK